MKKLKAISPLSPRWTLFIAISTIACFSLFVSARWLYAQILFAGDTPETVERAMHLAPLVASYPARLAQLRPERGITEYQRAIALNPLDSTRYLELSTWQEVAGAAEAAEANLLESARVSRYYLPRFALAAFYFRHENKPEFRIWAREALAVTSSTPRPLFQMAESLGFSHQEVGSQLVPERPKILVAWVEELELKGDIPETHRAAKRLLAIGSIANRTSVLGAADVLWQAGQLDDAASLWNELARRNWITYGNLDAPGWHAVSNASFSAEPLEQGFDWRMNAQPEVSIERVDGLHVEFSGKQSEDTWVAAQHLVLAAGRTYRLTTAYKTQGIPPRSGLGWVVRAQDGKPLADVLDISTGTEAAMLIRTPEVRQPCVLQLLYRRALGTTRIQGALTINRVQMELVP